ncbi:Sporulation thiol-disulfide oxidoreductase A precursor [Aquisphaera giovannonii]|uniref:Sporulation thiol-disulfide oxidoreductase A n=1 Tax=Aquisphaera giovannonii TaxID=406548 RepID=A0A5B9W687_9BACT|nr:redoxin family protein [Aquisphaera giovannonii]QEH36123.1 Sporulation thiol-disulfide oxidoreductase A precursor [Aquisphaera giovannonii]
MSPSSLIPAPRRKGAALLAGALALAAGTVVCLRSSILAQPPGVEPKAKAAAGDRPADPKAKALLLDVAKAYKALGAYSDEGQFVAAMTIGGKANKQEQSLKIAFVRPNKLDIDAGPVHMVSDGKTMTTAVAPLKRYTAVPAPEAINFETFRQGPTGSVLFGGITGAPMFIVLNMLTADDPVAALDQLGGSLQLDPKSPGNLLIDQQDAPDLKLVIDPATKLLSRIDFDVDPKLLARNAPEGQAVTIDRFGWAAGAVKTDAAKDHKFALEIPKGYSKVDDLRQGQGGGEEEQKYAVSEKVGSLAPDFTLTVLDGPGKTKTVTRSELAGKVVVIDFWATWCPPCMAELPEIQKLIESLAKDKKNVAVVALSEDSDPSELGEVRKLVEKTLAGKKITLTGNDVGLIALDPSGTIAKAFDIEGFPTLAILDAKGVVQSVHVGFSPDIRQKLEAEIDALLAGKPLAKGAEKKAAAAKD